MPIWDHEMEDDGQDDNRVLRATQKSRARWQKCIYLFKSVDANNLAEFFSRQTTGITPIQSAIRWIRAAFYRAISKYYLFWYNMRTINRVWHYVKEPSRVGTQVDLLRTEDNQITDTNIYLLAMEGGRPTRTFITRRGYVGMGPATIKPGDVVYICFGACVPHILRRRPDNGYEFVGEAYVHGIMDGEFMSEGRESEEVEIF